MRLPRLSELKIPLPRKQNRRRAVMGLYLLIGLLVIEQIPRTVFGWAVHHDFDTHPLGRPYNQLVRVLNIFVALLILLSGARAAKKWLPRFYAFMLGLLLFALWGAIWLACVERSSMFAFQLSMWHMFFGRLAMPFLLAYVVQHLLVWWPGSTRIERRAGVAFTVILAVAFGIGTLFTILGGPESLPLLAVHRWLSWILLPALALHIVLERRWRAKPVQVGTARAPDPATKFSRRDVRFALIVSVVLPFGVLALAKHSVAMPEFLLNLMPLIESTPTEQPSYHDPDPSYERPFGPSVFAPSRVEATTGKLADARWVQQSKSCGYEGCHVDITKTWALSGHRHSMNPFVQKAVSLLQAERGTAAARYCAGCHDPVNLLTGQIRDGGSPVTGIDDEGVTCTICHSTAHVSKQPGNASYAFGTSPIFFRRGVDRSRYLMTVVFLDDHFSEFKHDRMFEDPAFCGSCHVHHQPAEINPRELTVADKIGEWRAGPHSKPDGPKGVETCIDCHMQPETESYQQKPVHMHRFLSSNTGLASYYARDPAWDDYSNYFHRGVTDLKFTHQENLEMAQANLASGVVTMDVALVAAPVAAPSEAGDPSNVALDVSIANVGVGHGFPAGAHDLIDVWLQVEARDARGQTFWTSGVPDDRHFLPPGTVRFGSEWADEDGNPLQHHEIWRLASVRNERRIASGATEHERVAIPVPAGTAGPAKVRVRLRHRRFNQAFVDWVLADGTTMPITDVQDREVEVALP